MNNYNEWLKRQDVVRVLIAQVQVSIAGVLQTKYLSTGPVTVDSVEYLPIIKGGVDISSSISLEYTSSISFGDLDIINSHRGYDEWLNYNWTNKSCKLYYGEVPVSPTDQSLTADYELVFDGIVEDIDAKSASVLSLKLRDKLEKLNYPVTEALLGNYFHGAVLSDGDPSYTNQSRAVVKPLVFGEVNNITPLLTDPTQLEYMVSAVAVENIIEVLDNGVPVAFHTVKKVTEIGDIPPGSFRLDFQPVGTITASVQGVAKTIDFTNATHSDSYTNTIANAIGTILKFYGKPLEYTEIDVPSFTTLGAEPIGVYLTDRTNSFVLCSELAKSANCALAVTRQGKVKLVELDIPVTATYAVHDGNTILNSAKLVRKPDILAGIKLGYARNWTVMANVVTGIPEEHKDLLSTEYLEISVKDDIAKAAYSVTTEPALVPTYLISTADATSNANSRLTLRSTSRKIVGMQCTSELLHLEVGSPILVNIDRFGIPINTVGLVLATKPDWLNGKIDIEILV